MLRLLTMPIRVGLSLTGRVLDEVRSAVLGSGEGQQARPQPAAPQSRTAPAPQRDQPQRDEPDRDEPDGGAEERPSGRDASASGWDEDAPVPPGGSDPDDLIVLDRVRTEIFQPADAEKGSVNVSVENGVVYLRGSVDDPAQAEYFEVTAAGVDGVVRVENLIATS